MSLSRSPELILVAKTVARGLRRNQTSEEQILWEAIRNKKFMGRKFLRQHPILVDHRGRETFFVADFYCAASKLVVEIDGEIHDNRKERDETRTAIINERGLRVVRFKNESIKRNLPFVLGKLKKYL